MSRARTVGRPGVVTASVVALALAGGAAGGIFMTRQRTTTSPTASIQTPAATTKPVTAPASATAPVTAVGTAPVTASASQYSAAIAAADPPASETVQSFADLYQEVRSGVVRIQATTCDGGGVGTGFLIAPDLVATVAHGVDESASLNLTFGENGAGGTTSGVVIGIDSQADVALVRLDRRIRGHVFTVTPSG